MNLPKSKFQLAKIFFEQYAANCNEFKILLEENETDMFRSTRTPTNIRNVIATLKALSKIPDFTDDQEEIIRRIINAFRILRARQAK